MNKYYSFSPAKKNNCTSLDAVFHAIFLLLFVVAIRMHSEGFQLQGW